jgi:16S rRNA (guanine966-N2)-methyltransferase
MRIIAGAHRGRQIVAPKGHYTRPTADRTRQALYNVLEHAPWSPGLVDARVMDLFAGSGALGLEALSRGAAFCLLADNDPAALSVIRENARTLRLEDRIGVRTGDVTRLPAAAPGEAAFEIAFLDPPYAQGLAEPTLAALRAGGWLAPDAVVVVERGLSEAALLAPGYCTLDTRDWGAARVSFLSPRPEA